MNFNSLLEIENHFRTEELRIQCKYPILTPSVEDSRKMSIELQQCYEEKTKEIKKYIEKQNRYKEKASDRELLEKIYERIILGK